MRKIVFVEFRFGQKRDEKHQTEGKSEKLLNALQSKDIVESRSTAGGNFKFFFFCCLREFYNFFLRNFSSHFSLACSVFTRSVKIYKKREFIFGYTK